MMKKFTFIDLFSGIGGFRLALERNGGECIGFSEINKDAITYYCKNYKEEDNSNFGDITKIKSLPKHDILVGGVPCQSWSIAGKNLGFDDDRGQLWNDTIYLLNQSRPKAFIFENVKGLVDPRNKESLQYILDRIKEAGYFADVFVINSSDFGVPQNRIRIYIIGFDNAKDFHSFKINKKHSKKRVILAEVLGIELENEKSETTLDLFGNSASNGNMSLSSTNGLNDYFLFNDLRNGHSTIHSWDILETTEREKEICLALLRNRRKSKYGKMDGNPLSLMHFQELITDISQSEIDILAEKGILKPEQYLFKIIDKNNSLLTVEEHLILERYSSGDSIVIDDLKLNKNIKLSKINIVKILEELTGKGIIECIEVRYDFKNTKISTGLYGVNRIFLPTSDIFPTLVASDTNDFVTTEIIQAKNETEFRNKFISEIYKKEKYRKITKEEACIIQGFPTDFELPENRARWMKLVGNSVSVPVIEVLIKSIIETGVFENKKENVLV